MTELLVTTIGITLLPKLRVNVAEALPEITPTPSTVIVDPLEEDEGVTVIFLVEVELV